MEDLFRDFLNSNEFNKKAKDDELTNTSKSMGIDKKYIKEVQDKANKTGRTFKIVNSKTGKSKLIIPDDKKSKMYSKKFNLTILSESTRERLFDFLKVLRNHSKDTTMSDSLVNKLVTEGAKIADLIKEEVGKMDNVDNPRIKTNLTNFALLINRLCERMLTYKSLCLNGKGETSIDINIEGDKDKSDNKDYEPNVDYIDRLSFDINELSKYVDDTSKYVEYLGKIGDEVNNNDNCLGLYNKYIKATYSFYILNINSLTKIPSANNINMVSTIEIINTIFKDTLEDYNVLLGKSLALQITEEEYSYYFSTFADKVTLILEPLFKEFENEEENN